MRGRAPGALAEVAPGRAATCFNHFLAEVAPGRAATCFNHFLAELAPAHEFTAQPMFSRILLTQLRRIGDVLMTTPAVRVLRQAYPEARITYLTEAPADQVLAANPHIDEVLIWPHRKGIASAFAMMRRLRARRFDLAVDFFSNPTSAKITRFTGAAQRIGFAFRGRKWAYTHALPIPPLPYAAQHKLGLIAPLDLPASSGPREPSLVPQVFLSEADRAFARRQLAELSVAPGDLLAAISPVSRRDYRVWPAENYARMADVLIERYGAKVLFLWGPGEESFVDAVRLEMLHQALPDYPVPSLMQMAALLERANLFIGNNNGPRHIAIAVNTPTVGVFGRGFPENWTPPHAPLHLTVEYDPGCKQACTYPRCGRECIRDSPYAAVEHKVETLLEELLKDGTPA